jgi:predicted small lipoprotein YifL
MKKIIYLYLSAIIFMSGCGTKGPLYIPEEKYPQDSKLEDNFSAQENKVA